MVLKHKIQPEEILYSIYIKSNHIFDFLIFSAMSGVEEMESDPGPSTKLHVEPDPAPSTRFQSINHTSH